MIGKQESLRLHSSTLVGFIAFHQIWYRGMHSTASRNTDLLYSSKASNPPPFFRFGLLERAVFEFSRPSDSDPNNQPINLFPTSRDAIPGPCIFTFFPTLILHRLVVPIESQILSICSYSLPCRTWPSKSNIALAECASQACGAVERPIKMAHLRPNAPNSLLVHTRARKSFVLCS